MSNLVPNDGVAPTIECCGVGGVPNDYSIDICEESDLIMRVAVLELELVQQRALAAGLAAALATLTARFNTLTGA